ncbi:hypothetical protein EU528_04250 [Candidatus Thorarchaeota archaeon]|nr:MAG: hypothetical protein EU528_04250 [Candidatus Thorarchaeota archaeon]
MKTIEFSSEFDQKVLQYLRRNYSKIFSKGWNYNNSTLAVFVHEEYVLRTSSNQTITIIFEPTGIGGKSRITIISSGGGQGLFGFDWGSQNAAENTLVKRIKEITASNY